MDQNYGYNPNQAAPVQPTAAQPVVVQAPAYQPAQAQAAAPLPPLPKQRWYVGLGKLVACGIGMVVILFAPAFLYDIPARLGFDWDEDLVYELVSAVIAIIVAIILGGKQLFTYSNEDRKIAWKAVWWSIAISAVMMAISIWDTISEGIEIAPDWPINFAYALFLCIGIGFFEEGMCRGVLLGGLMAKFGRTKAGVWFAVILSSLIFGAMHIDFSSDIDPSNMLTIAQAALKILQTGMYGFVLAAVTVRTRSIFWPALLHGLDDFLLFIPDVVLLGDTVETEYVSTGDDAMVSVIFYIIICVLYIPLVVKGVKLLLGITTPDRGALMHRWEKKRAAQLAMSGVEREGVVLASMAGVPALAYGTNPQAPQGYGAQPQAPQGYGTQPQAPQGYATQQPQYQQPYQGYSQPAAPPQQVAQQQYPQQYPAQYPQTPSQQGIPAQGNIPTSGETPPPTGW